MHNNVSVQAPSQRRGSSSCWTSEFCSYGVTHRVQLLCVEIQVLEWHSASNTAFWIRLSCRAHFFPTYPRCTTCIEQDPFFIVIEKGPMTHPRTCLYATEDDRVWNITRPPTVFLGFQASTILTETAIHGTRTRRFTFNHILRAMGFGVPDVNALAEVMDIRVSVLFCPRPRGQTPALKPFIGSSSRIHVRDDNSEFQQKKKHHPEYS